MEAVPKTKYEIIDTIIEYGVYVYIFFIFLSKGEGIITIVIFMNFGLWLFTLKYRKNLYILKDPVSKLCWIYAGVTLLSVIFSIDPMYSLDDFKGEPLKLAILFPVIATVMSNKKRLERALYVMLISLILMVSIGYYSYIFSDLPFLKPDTVLMHAWHNRFAGYINTFIPFVFILFFIWKKPALKAVLFATLVLIVFALVLSTSRGGYLAFFVIAVVWSLYLSRTGKYNFKKLMSSLILIVLIIGAFSYLYFPDVTVRMNTLSTDVYTLNERTELWGAAIEAITDKPVFGWGYGDEIFFWDAPFVNTSYKTAPPKGPHNQFLTVLFHQGITGLVPYVLLIIVTIITFWKAAINSTGIKGYVLVACVSVFLGNYFFHALIESMFKLRHIALIIGLGLAAKGMNENSDR